MPVTTQTSYQISLRYLQPDGTPITAFTFNAAGTFRVTATARIGVTIPFADLETGISALRAWVADIEKLGISPVPPTSFDTPIKIEFDLNPLHVEIKLVIGILEVIKAEWLKSTNTIEFKPRSDFDLSWDSFRQYNAELERLLALILLHKVHFP